MITPDEQRKLVALRILPSAHRQAKIAAVTEGKTLGVWIEEAIREKVEREGSSR
jgi:predicted HicB family RNase H-like nuclease